MTAQHKTNVYGASLLTFVFFIVVYSFAPFVYASASQTQATSSVQLALSYDNRYRWERPPRWRHRHYYPNYYWGPRYYRPAYWTGWHRVSRHCYKRCLVNRYGRVFRCVRRCR